MNHASYFIANETEIDRFGAQLASILPVHILLALNGDLGAGKTRLTRSLAEAWQIPSDEIRSPTFVLCHEYHGTRHVLHLDAYRLTDESELFDLGFEEMLSFHATVILEWAQRMVGCLPPRYMQIDINILAPESRLLTLTEVGGELGILSQLKWAPIV